MQAVTGPNLSWRRDRVHAPTKGPTVNVPLHARALLRALLAAAVTLTVTAAAQDAAPAEPEVVVTTYYLDQLNVQPGRLDLSPNYLTLIEFPDLIDTVATGRADLIQVEVDDNRILLKPTRSNGRTDLIVKVDGVNALFRVEIDGENGTPRRYVVHAVKPRQTPAPQVADNAAAVNPMPTQTETLGQDPAHPQAAPAPFEFTYSARTNQEGRLTIYYTLRNASQNPIANEGTRLKLVDDLGEVPYSVTRMNPGSPNRLMPGAEEHGVITAERSHYGQARIQWPVVEQGPGHTYIINELVVNIQHE